MRPAALALILLLSACGGGDGNESAGPESREAKVQTRDLTGLYEGEGRTRMCMISRPSGTIAFGVVIWTPDGGTCSGAGEVVRQGDVLRLSMAGDEECLIEARMTGTQLTLPTNLPEGCAYYCGPGATLAGETFEKTGGTAEAAVLATDLVGDPLCS